MFRELERLTAHLNSMTAEMMRSTTDAKICRILFVHLRGTNLPLELQNEVFAQANISISEDLDPGDLAIVDAYLKAAVEALALSFQVLTEDYGEDIAIKTLMAKAASFSLTME